jgi:RHS repeat-associated protein
MQQAFDKRAGKRWALAVFAAAVMFAPLARSQAPADPYSYSRITSYSYDSVGRLQTEVVEPDNLASCVTSSYAYDAWGNRSSVTVANCAGAVPARAQFTSRVSTLDYSASAGQYPTVATNALNQTATAAYDARFGAKTSATAVDGLSVNWTLDDFGRVTKETRPDGTSVVSRYCWLPGRVSDLSSNSAGCAGTLPADAPADAASYIETEPQNTAGVQMGPRSRLYNDRAGRELRRTTQSFDGANQPAGLSGALIALDTTYNADGTPALKTQPYFLSSGSSTTGGAADRGITKTRYDALGRVLEILSTDPQGQAGSQSFAAGSVNYGAAVAARVAYAYSGNTTTITNDRGQVRTEERNAIGRLVRITDPAGAQLVHQHDAFGNLVATKDPLGNSITLKYSIRGAKLEMNDPDAGLWKYDVDAIGQLVWQENPNQRALGQSTTMVYDKLGRMTSRSEPEGTGAWYYDKYADATSCGNGRLCESRYTLAGSGQLRTNRNTYDSLGRQTVSRATVTNGPALLSAQSYDSQTGRLATKTYPTGVQVGYGYTALGFAHQLKLLTQLNLSPLPATPGGTPGSATTIAANTVLWQARQVNAWGQAEQQLLANGIASRSTVQPQTGRTTALTAGPGSSNTVVNQAYGWDSLNNLLYRADNIGDAIAGAVTENFEYADGLSRLTKYTVAAPGVPGGSRSVNLVYNALGMLLAKSDVGVYTYGAAGSARPHALLSLAPTGGGAATTYGYDANGNLITASAGKYRSIAYTSFNLPDSQNGIGGETTGGSTPRYTWVYDESHQRIKEVRTITGGTMAGTRTTWYLHPDNAGNLGFEQDVNSPTMPSASNPAATSNRHYLSFGARAIGVLVTTGSIATTDTSTSPPSITSIAAVKLEYWHKDHLGSLIATTDHLGAVTARYAYDPFGKRRYTNGSYDAFGAIVVDFSPATNAGTDRGYTEHEHLDDVGIIHMNGRLFDPTTGRFLQTDPLIQAPDNLQNYNRYAYCFNNPLTCTDPTGFASFGGQLRKLLDGAGGVSAGSDVRWEVEQRWVAAALATVAPASQYIGVSTATVVRAAAAANPAIGAVFVVGTMIYVFCDSCQKTVDELATRAGSWLMAAVSSGDSSSSNASNVGGANSASTPPGGPDDDGEPKLTTNPKHHPNSRSPEPKNVDQLYENSVVDKNGVRWAKDTDGTIHRFSKPSNGETHWNGSTGGVDPIQPQNIPVEIRRLFGVKG